MNSTARVPLVVAALALGFATAELSGCGSGSASSAASSAAKAATGAVSSAAGGVSSKTTSATGAVGSQTVTKTATQPAAPTSIANSTSITNSTSINAQVTNAPPATADSGGGLRWWGWLLIALVAVGVLVAIYTAGRRRGKSTVADSPPSEVQPAVSPEEKTPTAMQ